MSYRPRVVRYLAAVTLIASLLSPAITQANNIVDPEHGIFIVRPLVTEPAWVQSGFYLNSMLFDLPNALSRPYPQVGFMFQPGLTWSLFDMLELNLGFPLILNPDETGEDDSVSPTLKNASFWDDTPDFDLPGLVVGLKAKLLGNQKANSRFYLAVGVNTSLPLFEKTATNLLPPKTSPGSSYWLADTLRIDPYLTMALNVGQLSPQLQVGTSIRMPATRYNPDTYEPERDASGSEVQEGFVDLFFNLAVPIAFLFENTAPMIEFNGVFGEEGSQLFITPAITFLPDKSPALISFACMIPVLDSDFRSNEGFRFLVNFSYRFDMLSVPAFWQSEEEEKAGELPPAGW